MRRTLEVPVGSVFHRLTTIAEPHYRSGDTRRYIQCLCECGKAADVLVYSLSNGSTQSCGCQARERNIERITQHGEAQSRLYTIWAGMKARCQNPKNPAYSYYGGRGIQVCSEWQEYIPFSQWAKASGYDESLTIDRKDTNGNYCPENCAWTTREQQSNNLRTNHMITAFGETKSSAMWVRDPRCLVAIKTIKWRIDRGMTTEEAITTPPTKPQAAGSSGGRRERLFPGIK